MTPLAHHMHLIAGLREAWNKLDADAATQRRSRFTPLAGYDEHGFRQGGITQRTYRKLCELERASIQTLTQELKARSDHVAEATRRLIAKGLARRKRTGFYEIV